MAIARRIEPLEEVIDDLKEQLRARHIYRLQEGKCSIAAGFVWSDILTNLERTADHCSNVAVCVIDASEHNMNAHQAISDMKKGNAYFDEKYAQYAEKYL